jgi:hypothetical protein
MRNWSKTNRRVRTAVLLATVASVTPWRLHPALASPPCTKADAQVAETADNRTTQEIERRIATDESVGALASQVQVSTEQGVVTLRGAISNDEDRMVLASLAESAPGVRHVEDRLEVRRWHTPPSVSRAQ